MEKRNKKQNKMMETARHWRVGDYIRQLSIVILGVFVTFWVSDAIGEYSKQKEIRSIMGLVKEELKVNQERLTEVEQQLTKERKMARVLRDNGFRYQEIPEDTLEYYKILFNRLSSFSASKNAMEVFKNSGLIQHIADKRIILSLSETYDVLAGTELTIAGYYNLKNEATAAMSKVGIYFGNNAKEYYGYCLGFTEWKSFVSVAPGYFYDDFFSVRQKILLETIKKIEEKYE